MLAKKAHSKNKLPATDETNFCRVLLWESRFRRAIFSHVESSQSFPWRLHFPTDWEGAAVFFLLLDSEVR
jgi:hypothetical protein